MAQWNPHHRVLNQFSRKVLLEYVLPMNFMESVPESEASSDGSSSIESVETLKKADLVSRSLHKLKRLGTAEDTYRHLLLIGARTTRPKWHMHKFERNVDNDEVMLDDPTDMQAQIVRSLQKKYRVEVAVQRREGVYWLVVALAARPKKKSQTAKVPNLINTFLVHRANSTAIAVKGLRKAFESDLFEALKVTLKFETYEPMNLIDTNLDGMFQMAAEEGRPDVLPGDDEESISSEDEITQIRRSARGQIIDLQEDEKKKRKHFSHKHFGRDSPPSLTFASYKIVGPFKGAKTLPSLAQYANKPMTMTIRIRGSDVMRGIRSMVQQGVMNTNRHLAYADLRISGANIHDMELKSIRK